MAAEAGADAVGLVFFAGSPRCVCAETARAIVAALPPFVSAVGLFVDEEPARVRQVADFCGLDLLQLHGDEPPEGCSFPPRRVIKAIRVKTAASLQALDDYAVSAILLDAWAPGSYGGTGERFDWNLAAGLARQRRIVLAGGLTPDNVAEAVRTVRPWAVDVSSGVEAAPGRKDAAKLAAFIRAAKGV